MTTNSLTIQDVIKQFDIWRAKRSSRRVPFPEELRVMAVKLSQQESYSSIRNALRISGGQFKQWQNEAAIKPKIKSKKKTKLSKFVTLPLVESKTIDVNPTEQNNFEFNLNCELIRADGFKMLIYADRNNINFLMNTFLGGSQ